MRVHHIKVMRYDIENERQLELLPNFTERVTTVSISIFHPIKWRRQFPSHVTGIIFSGAALYGPVIIQEGITRVSVVRTRSQLQPHEWHWPDSIKEVTIFECGFDRIDLAALKLVSLTLDSILTRNAHISLPPTLESFSMASSRSKTLPALPDSVTTLRVEYCPRLRDYGSGDHKSITTLTTNRLLSLYENLPSLTKLVVNNAIGWSDQILLTHLRELTFNDCIFDGRVEINAPNLETLTISGQDVIRLSGSFAESVKTLTLYNYYYLPEADSWDSLEEFNLIIDDGSFPSHKLELPCLPWLRRINLDYLVNANGVEVWNLREYREAWGLTRRKKGSRV